jgi:hypothetical protein
VIGRKKDMGRQTARRMKGEKQFGNAVNKGEWKGKKELVS